MNESEIQRSGLVNARPGREAVTGSQVHGDGLRPKRGGRHREETMVPPAEFTSYYGQPVLNKPTWEARDIAGYLFLGGLAGGSSIIAALSQLTGRPGLARICKFGSTASIGLSLIALIHDLGRPSRFVNMLRVFKPTSPMSVGSWIVATFAPLSFVASASEATGIAPLVGSTATAGAAIVGPALVTYTAALISNTAVPGWHEGFREMPFLFAASGAASASGLALALAPDNEIGPVRRIGAFAGVAEVAISKVMERKMGMVGEVFHQGKAGKFGRLADMMLIGGSLGTLVGKRNQIVRRAAGIMLLCGSALTRFSVFEAGVASSEDPKYTIVPQKQRVYSESSTKENEAP